MKTYYLYNSHTGGVYITEEYFEPEICEICRDFDVFMGEFRTPKQLRRMMEKIECPEWYIEEVLEEFAEKEPVFRKVIKGD